MVNGQPFVLDNTGRSGSKVLIFEDTVLKIQPDTEHLCVGFAFPENGR